MAWCGSIDCGVGRGGRGRAFWARGCFSHGNEGQQKLTSTYSSFSFSSDSSAVSSSCSSNRPPSDSSCKTDTTSRLNHSRVRESIVRDDDNRGLGGARCGDLRSDDNLDDLGAGLFDAGVLLGVEDLSQNVGRLL